MTQLQLEALKLFLEGWFASIADWRKDAAYLGQRQDAIPESAQKALTTFLNKLFPEEDEDREF